MTISINLICVIATSILGLIGWILRNYIVDTKKITVLEERAKNIDKYLIEFKSETKEQLTEIKNLLVKAINEHALTKDTVVETKTRVDNLEKIVDKNN